MSRERKRGDCFCHTPYRCCLQWMICLCANVTVCYYSVECQWVCECVYRLPDRWYGVSGWKIKRNGAITIIIIIIIRQVLGINREIVILNLLSLLVYVPSFGNALNVDVGVKRCQIWYEHWIHNPKSECVCVQCNWQVTSYFLSIYHIESLCLGKWCAAEQCVYARPRARAYMQNI